MIIEPGDSRGGELKNQYNLTRLLLAFYFSPHAMDLHFQLKDNTAFTAEKLFSHLKSNYSTKPTTKDELFNIFSDQDAWFPHDVPNRRIVNNLDKVLEYMETTMEVVRVDGLNLEWTPQSTAAPVLPKHNGINQEAAKLAQAFMEAYETEARKCTERNELKSLYLDWFHENPRMEYLNRKPPEFGQVLYAIAYWLKKVQVHNGMQLLWRPFPKRYASGYRSKTSSGSSSEEEEHKVVQAAAPLYPPQRSMASVVMGQPLPRLEGRANSRMLRNLPMRGRTVPSTRIPLRVVDGFITIEPGSLMNSENIKVLVDSNGFYRHCLYGYPMTGYIRVQGHLKYHGPPLEKRHFQENYEKLMLKHNQAVAKATLPNFSNALKTNTLDLMSCVMMYNPSAQDPVMELAKMTTCLEKLNEVFKGIEDDKRN